jgi:hypothetical protein
VRCRLTKYNIVLECGLQYYVPQIPAVMQSSMFCIMLPGIFVEVSYSYDLFIAIYMFFNLSEL